jgi:hypothetical protein
LVYPLACSEYTFLGSLYLVMKWPYLPIQNAIVLLVLTSPYDI